MKFRREIIMEYDGQPESTPANPTTHICIRAESSSREEEEKEEIRGSAHEKTAMQTDQAEKLMLLGHHRSSGGEHGLGLLHPWVDYIPHVPFHVPRIPHTEGMAFWDNWWHHAPAILPNGSASTEPVSDYPESGARDTQRPPPSLAVRLVVLVLLFLLVFGPTLSYSSVGALYTQLKSDLGSVSAQSGVLWFDAWLTECMLGAVDMSRFSDSQLGFLFSAYALPNIVAVFFAGVQVTDQACGQS